MPHRTPPLGQHFLHDSAVAGKIVDALEPDGSEVLEIGPGRGALTFELAERAARLVAVELDRRLAKTLAAEPRIGGATILHGDVLERPLADWMEPLPEEGFLLAGNLPYAITSPVLFACFEARPGLKRAVLMMQHEVARRLAAPPGSRTYGIVSVLGSVHARIELLFTVGSGAFKPPPGVTSAVVRLILHPQPLFGIASSEGPSEAWFRAVVKAAFGQRRKMLKNSLAGGLGHIGAAALEAAARTAGIDLTRRAESLAPEEFVRLARALPRPGVV